MSHGLKAAFEIVGEEKVGSAQVPPFRFGRLFGASSAPPFQPTDGALRALGEAMTATPQATDSDLPAGYTYFGQFIDHDVTFDAIEFAKDIDPGGMSEDELTQRRSPSLDLDSLYGNEWPKVRSDLFESDGLTFRLGPTTSIPEGIPGGPLESFPGFDVPRDQGGKAIIGDPRNDENLIVQQLHLAFLKFHNRVASVLRQSAPSEPADIVLLRTRELVTLHYQWLVIEDFVRRVVLPETFTSVLGVPSLLGATTVAPKLLIFPVVGSETPPMPLEFSAAAYRFGHTIVRERYGWNRIFPNSGFDLFFRFTELSGDVGSPGLETFPSNWIADWRRMFPLEDAGVPINRAVVALNRARSFDPHLAPVLGNLPKSGSGTDKVNLAVRNLIRGSRVRLPSGQDIAKAIVLAGDPTAAPMTPEQILSGLPAGMQKALTDHELHIKSPLWFYILREAQVKGASQRLGPVGSRIVLETFVGLVRASVTSIFSSSTAAPGQLTVFSPHTSRMVTPNGAPITSMSHLLASVGDINPLGD